MRLKETFKPEEIIKIVTEVVNKISANYYSLKEIQLTVESDLINDVGFDSLDYIEFAVDLESRFSITINDTDFTEIPVKTIGSICEYISEIEVLTPY